SISWNRDHLSKRKTIYDSMPSPQIVSTKDKTESSTKQSTQSLASSSIVIKFVQGLLEEFLSSYSQLLEPIKFSFS
ncbi:12589_t:CDS:1, partial [Funneliformis geosporum]